MSAESRKHFVINNFVHGLKLFIADFCSSIDLALSFELICKNNQTVIINFLGEENPDEIHNGPRPHHQQQHEAPLLPPPPLPPRDDFPVATSTPTSTANVDKPDFRHGNKKNNGAGHVGNDASSTRNGGREDPRRPAGAPIVPLAVPAPPVSMSAAMHSPITTPQNIPLPLGVPPPPVGVPPPAVTSSSSNRISEKSVFGQPLRYASKDNDDLTPENENRGWAEPENWRRRQTAAAASSINNNDNQSKNKNDVRPNPAAAPPQPNKPEEKKRRGGGGGNGAEDRVENLDSTVNYLFDELELEDTPRKRKQVAPPSLVASKEDDSAAASTTAAAGDAETPSPPDAKRRVRFEKKEGFICSKCGQFFNRFRNFYLHQVKRHDKKKKDEILEGIKDKKFKCPDCLFSSDCKREIDKHRKKYHHDLYKCSQCTFSTYTRTKLNEHAQIYH